MDTTSDLDLHAYFPWGTHVWYAARQGEPAHLRQGEYLTHDANVPASTAFVGAVERIYFPAHDGLYRFRVHNFTDRQAGNNPYVLQVFFGHQTYTEVGNLGGTGSENNYYYNYYRQTTGLTRHATPGMTNRAPATTLTQTQLAEISSLMHQYAAGTMQVQQSRGVNPLTQTSASLLEVLRANENNPSSNPLSPEFLRSMGHALGFTEDVASVTAEILNAQVHYGIGDLDFSSPGFEALSQKLHALESGGQIAGTAVVVLQFVTLALDTQRVRTAQDENEFALAVNQWVRNRIAWAAGLAGAKARGLAGAGIGVWIGGIGAVIGSPIGAVFVGLGSAFTAGAAYDKWISDAVIEYARNDFPHFQARHGRAYSHGPAITNASFQ